MPHTISPKQVTPFHQTTNITLEQLKELVENTKPHNTTTSITEETINDALRKEILAATRVPPQITEHFLSDFVNRELRYEPPQTRTVTQSAFSKALSQTRNDFPFKRRKYSFETLVRISLLPRSKQPRNRVESTNSTLSSTHGCSQTRLRGL